MEPLFVIDTDQAKITWSAVRAPRRAPQGVAGFLRVTGLREGLVFGEEAFRAGLPVEVARDPDDSSGPILLEQSDYEVYVRARVDGRVTLRHEEATLFASLREEEGGRVLHGLVNFRAHIGHSTFTVSVGGVPEVSFEVEVFPSKLDYMEDYQRILADVQEIATALGLTYLASTRQEGQVVPADRPTELEWALLLRLLIDDLERALRHVADHPLRGIERRSTPQRTAQVKRADSAIRAAVARGRGKGSLTRIPGGIPVREWLPAGRPTPTLDTPEHRWLAAQLATLRRRLGALRRTTAAKRVDAKQRQALGEIDRLEVRLAALERLEPLAAAAGEPPPGFASLRLLNAPGYREAYRALVTLARGLRVTGGPLGLPVKDLAALYEVWCLLATLRVLSRIPGVALDLREVFRVGSDGLEVRLVRGQSSKVRATGPGGRTLVVQYNPSIRHPYLLTPQRPDILLTIEDRGWPSLRLVLDAKYRVDDDPAYVRRYGAPGPPDVALNVLHRYRDAILEKYEKKKSDAPPKRGVVQAAALFPYHPAKGSDFAETRLYRSLSRVGIGAIPLLPGETGLLERWLRGAVLGGTWALAETAPTNPPREHAADWRRAAAEPVLIGTLRDENPAEQLAWVIKNRCYYTPLTKGQGRQYVARWVGLYSPEPLSRPGAVTHLAKVTDIEVKRRGEMNTPWAATRGDDETVLVYHLGKVKEKKPPIVNTDGRRLPVRTWSSRLAVDRALELAHLSLETAPEWQLHEKLTTRGIAFHIEAGAARVQDPVNPLGRALFRGDNEKWKVQYGGSGGFKLDVEGQEQRWLADEDDVVRAVEGE